MVSRIPSDTGNLERERREGGDQESALRDRRGRFRKIPAGLSMNADHQGPPGNERDHDPDTTRIVSQKYMTIDIEIVADRFKIGFLQSIWLKCQRKCDETGGESKTDYREGAYCSSNAR